MAKIEEKVLNELKEKLIERLKPSGWATKLKTFVHSSSFDKIISSLWDLKEDDKRFTPPLKQMFNAFENCNLNNLKVIMLTGAPYYKIGVADGMAFSCGNNNTAEPVLEYIFNEINKTIYNNDTQHNPDLKRWAEQGVLLLNVPLTAQIDKTGNHYPIWEEFITYVIDILNLTQSGLIWVLMSEQAYELEDMINPKAHYVIKTDDPLKATYSNAKEWNCNDCFNKINDIIIKNNGKEYLINW
jgi:uracil-DNA glycosylase